MNKTNTSTAKSKRIVVKGKNKEQPVLMPCGKVYN